jgi:hypothetical protein
MLYYIFLSLKSYKGFRFNKGFISRYNKGKKFKEVRGGSWRFIKVYKKVKGL